MRDGVPTPTIEDGAVRRLAACSCTTAKRTRWAARTPWTTWSFAVLPTICWRPSRTLAEATWTASAARRRRAAPARHDRGDEGADGSRDAERSAVRGRSALLGEGTAPWTLRTRRPELRGGARGVRRSPDEVLGSR